MKKRHYYPREHIEMLRRIVPLEVVVGMFVQKFIRSGPRRLLCLCPFHGEKTPSFMIWTRGGPGLGWSVPSYFPRDRYKCHGCTSSGDVFQFLMDIQGINFVEAIDTIEILAFRPERIMAEKE